MLLDGHVHMMDLERDPAAFLAELAEAGVDGALVISYPPKCFSAVGPPRPDARRLEALIRIAEAHDALYPVHWIDPLADDVSDQIDAALRAGVMGFKVICNRFHPWEETPMAVFDAVARAGKPILFHSGILWDGTPSGRFNRPAGFEALIEIPGLRFALAHISWPWCDECVAVYGKLLNARARRPELSSEMFIDTTPGTPELYRRDALTKLFTIYDAAHNVIFGSDSDVAGYGGKRTREWVDRDTAILTDLGLPPETLDGYLAGNLRRFLGLDPTAAAPRLPKRGE